MSVEDVAAELGLTTDEVEKIERRALQKLRRTALDVLGNDVIIELGLNPSGAGRRSADLVGKRFGSLVAAEAVSRDANRNVVWRCNCDCGVTTTARATSLLLGLKVHCGCRRGKRAA